MRSAANLTQRIAGGGSSSVILRLDTAMPQRIQAISTNAGPLYTYMHDKAAAADRLFPKPDRWPRYNEVIHSPEDGPVERVSDTNLSTIR